MKPGIYTLLTFFTLAAWAQPDTDKSYLNQKPPGMIPEIFAPGVVSLTTQHEFGSVFSRDGKEFFYGVVVDRKAEIRHMKLDGEKWTLPGTLLSSDKYSFNDPFLSPDEKRLYFISDIPFDGVSEKKDYDIWYIEKTNDNWSMPQKVGRPVNSTKNEYYISFTEHGTLYFSSNVNAPEDNRNNFDIYSAANKAGEFMEPEKMSDSINTRHYEADVFVAYDESYLIFCGDRPEGYGRGDLYISFKDQDGTWTKAKNMGSEINSEDHELCPFVSKDGKYLFYTRNKDIYWADAGIIERFR